MKDLFCISYKWGLQSVPNAPMGYTPRAITDHVEHDQAFKMQPKYFSAHDDGGQFWQKKNAVGATKEQGHR